MFELQAPIVPTPDTSSLQYVAKGLASMVAQRQHNQQLELAYQKMAQDALIDQQKVDVTRQQLAQQLPLQQAQIGNLNAEASFHNAEAYYTRNVKGQELQDQKELLDQANEYNKTTAEQMQGKWGTTEGQNILGLQDAQYAAIKGTKVGMQSVRDNYVKQRREELNNVSTLNTLRKNMDDTARQGLGYWANNPAIAAAPGQLAYDPQTKKFQANNVWGVNDKSNDPYLTVNAVRDAKGGWIGYQVVPPGQGTPDSQFVTLPKATAESYVQQRSAFLTKASGLAGPPPSTVQAFGQQQEAQVAPPTAVNYLRANPDPGTRAQFDTKFGAGAASQILGN